MKATMKAGIALASIAATLFALPALAQQPPMGGADKGMGMGGAAGPGQRQPRPPRGCSKSRNPEACTAHQEARKQANDACQGKAAAERRQCMKEQMQNVDCSKMRNPQQCEARQQAYGECKEQTGAAFKQCVQQKMPPPDCSKAANPQQCEQHAKARDACKDKAGPEHRSCLREMLAPAK